MKTTVISGSRKKMIGHLRAALAKLEEGGDHYRLSSTTETGRGSDLVFEIDPQMDCDPDSFTHLEVVDIDKPFTGRPENWVPGESKQKLLDF